MKQMLELIEIYEKRIKELEDIQKKQNNAIMYLFNSISNDK